jgi:hypothetical protein
VSTTATPKRRRVTRIKADLWMQLAMTAQRWADQVSNKAPGLIPFDQWPADDPLRQMCERHDLAPSELALIITSVADQLEARSESAGYGEGGGR